MPDKDSFLSDTLNAHMHSHTFTLTYDSNSLIIDVCLAEILFNVLLVIDCFNNILVRVNIIRTGLFFSIFVFNNVFLMLSLTNS